MIRLLFCFFSASFQHGGLHQWTGLRRLHTHQYSVARHRAPLVSRPPMRNVPWRLFSTTAKTFDRVLADVEQQIIDVEKEIKKISEKIEKLEIEIDSQLDPLLKKQLRDEELQLMVIENQLREKKLQLMDEKLKLMDANKKSYKKAAGNSVRFTTRFISQL